MNHGNILYTHRDNYIPFPNCNKAHVMVDKQAQNKNPTLVHFLPSLQNYTWNRVMISLYTNLSRNTNAAT